MLRVSTLTAWAELQYASTSQTYLRDVLEPYRRTLAALWLACLRDYARIRGDSEVLQESASAAADVAYAGLGREVLLPVSDYSQIGCSLDMLDQYYEDSWTKILRAVGIAMKRQDPHILASVDAQESTSLAKANPDQYDNTAFFFIILGLVFELLASSSDGTDSSYSRQIAALDTLSALVRPEYCGIALFEPSVFAEFTSLLYRMVLTETFSLQSRLIDIVVSLVSTHDSRTLWGRYVVESWFQGRS